ncbi:hypothetical protein [Sphingobium baderi]|uniref:hypothetical protein n=1 Tax=Sphingobium baderi TaxID=1332080 RepID=UPI002B405CFF|nr:hypothetical protein [Sphingobium baderi]WRD76816.1 hypothetical protein QQ987_01315 [Sphingobium baderi]
MKDYCFVVFTKPVAGQDVEYNRWYDTRHVPDVLAVPGFVSARRYAADVEGGRQYLALYGMKADDPEAVLADLSARAGTERMPMSPALDNESISAVLYEALEPLEAASE